PVRDVLERVAGVIDRIAVAVRLVALFVLGAGLTVMAEALAQSRSRRLYESVILRTLGATRAGVARAFAVEYGWLGLVAGGGGGRAHGVARPALRPRRAGGARAGPGRGRVPRRRRPCRRRGLPRNVPTARPEALAGPPPRVNNGPARSGPPPGGRRGYHDH